MFRKLSIPLMLLLAAGLIQASLTPTLDTLMSDVQNYYQAFFEMQSEIEREDLCKQMESTVRKIAEYYKTQESPDANQSRITAKAFLLLGLVEHEMGDPTRTFHALQAVNKINPGVLEEIQPITDATVKAKIDSIETLWLPKFKKCSALVYGFRPRVILDTLEVDLKPTHLDMEDRTDENFKAITKARHYLNSQIRNESEEITILLPPGKYQLGGEFADIYPTRFQVNKDSEFAVFEITPDEYFNLRVFHCRDNLVVRLDTIKTEVRIDTSFVQRTDPLYGGLPENYQRFLLAEVEKRDSIVKNVSHEVVATPVEPEEIEIWKGNQRILNFSHLAFGVYEFRSSQKYRIKEELRFLRFLPEGLEWGMPQSQKIRAQNIYVKSGRDYHYCIY